MLFTITNAESNEMVPSKYNFKGSLYSSVFTFAIAYSVLASSFSGAFASSTKKSLAFLTASFNLLTAAVFNQPLSLAVAAILSAEVLSKSDK